MIVVVRDIPANDDRTVAVLMYDGVVPFDLGVACEIFGNAEWDGPGLPWYRLLLCAPTREPVIADGGLRLGAPYTLAKLRQADTIIIPPTEDTDRVPAEVLVALRAAHARGTRLVSLCTGAFILAAAGLLNGRRATTHWTEWEEMARRYPLVSVDPEVLYVDEGDILTSAGSAAGIDLCLHIVRQDYGTEVATRRARQMVMPPQRDGGQAQYIDAPMPELDSTNLFADTVAWLEEHLPEPVCVQDLAARSAMSPRTFARRFVATTGLTPYQWLLRQRVSLAQRLLEVSDLPIELVAERSGFVTAGNLRKHFSRAVHTSPHAYRRAFQDR